MTEKEKVLSLVATICNTETNCRGLVNNTENINALLSLKGINHNHVEVYEMPLNWDNQVLICFQEKSTKEYKELFAGIGTDGNFYFDIENTPENEIPITDYTY